jgi:hypothetical protein
MHLPDGAGAISTDAEGGIHVLMIGSNRLRRVADVSTEVKRRPRRFTDSAGTGENSMLYPPLREMIICYTVDRGSFHAHRFRVGILARGERFCEIHL